MDGLGCGWVLVIQQDRACRDLVRDLLTDEGYCVVAVASGAEALTRLGFLPDAGPDVILLDLLMPSMNGRAFARAYQARPGPHAPIVLLSGAANLAAIVDEIGAQGFVRKPFDIDCLLSVVGRFATAEPATAYATGGALRPAEPVHATATNAPNGGVSLATR
jgi:CheY-like chemotaxis protein